MLENFFKCVNLAKSKLGQIDEVQMVESECLGTFSTYVVVVNMQLYLGWEIGEKRSSAVAPSAPWLFRRIVSHTRDVRWVRLGPRALAPSASKVLLLRSSSATHMPFGRPALSSLHSAPSSVLCTQDFRDGR